MRLLAFIFLFILSSNVLLASTKMLILSTSMGKVSQASKGAQLSNMAKLEEIDITFKFEEEIKKEERLKEFSKYDIIMFESLAGSRSLNSMLAKYAKELDQLNEKKIIFPIAIENENPYRKNILIEDNKNLNTYWQNGGEQNFKNFAVYLNNKVLKNSNKIAQPAILIPKEGIYHPKNPKLVFTTLDEYAKFFEINLDKPSKPLIGIALHRGSITANNALHINAMIEYLENKGVQTIPYFTDITGKDFIGRQFLTHNNQTLVDVVISFQIMIIDHESLKDDYKKLNVPILHALYYGEGDETQWRNDHVGVKFPMIAMTYVIPETLGYTDGLIVAAQNKITKQLEPIKEQLESLGNKALNLSTLKRKNNSEKQVAIMYYNYPAGINNMGASFLNSPKSLEYITSQMKAQGYNVQNKDHLWFEKEATKSLKAYYEKGHDTTMIKEDVAALYPYDEYIKFFRKLPLQTQKTINKYWRSPRFSKMITRVDGKKYFLIPRIKLGNVIVMPQPRRSERVDKIGLKRMKLKDEDTKMWHNQKVPVSHSYLASYLYVRKHFKADALIHLGTHGTQEWMPGKERGLSIYDSALLPLGDLVVVYPYITNNLAEGMQVKRRGRGTLISHQTPPFSLSGTYKEIGEIMEIIGQYKSVDEGMLKVKLKEQITNLTIQLSMQKDLEYTKEAIDLDFDAYVAKVEDYILSMSGTAQPLGMHTFGTYPKEEYLITTVMQMLGKDFMTKADGKEYFAQDYSKINQSKAYAFVKQFAIENQNIETLKNDELKPYIELAKDYVNRFKNNKEIPNFLRALEAQFIESGIGGDSIRNPDSLPTGNNMYGFDPNKVPTKAAYETGKKLMEDFIANYYKENGQYPTKLTFNLWSLETMRHYGVLESQILYAMGVRPIWNETGISNTFIQNIVKQFLQNYVGETVGGWLAKIVTIQRIEFLLSLTPEHWLQKPKKMIRHAKKVSKGTIEDVEIIPYSKLKRPRIDTVVSVTGLYRDTFPQTMLTIAKAVEKVAKLKEENNHVRINTLNIKEKLKKEGLNEEQIERLSTVRIFSNKTGSYGSGIDDVDDTQKWDNETRLTQNYFETRGYYFGSDTKYWNEKIPNVNLYAQNLSGTQSVIFSRTSNLYGLLTSDDPFGYFGSISMAIRRVDGTNPKTYISNLRDPNNAKLQSTAEFMSQELRTRYFHPKWIQAMKEEGYSGATGVLDVVKNFWGWQVVDPSVVRDDQWNEFVKVYVDDKYNLNIKEWFTKTNPDALAQMLEKMVEAYRKGYWQADEKTIKQLLKEYEELQKNFNIKSYNYEFDEFKEKASLGFGLASLKKIAKNTNQTKEAKAKMQQAKPKVKGQKLEKVKKKMEMKKDYTNEIILALLFLLVLSGIVYEVKKGD